MITYNSITKPPLFIWQNHTFHTASSFDAQIFSDAPDTARWIVPIHHVVVHNMVAMATQADQSLRQNGNAAPGKLSAAATYLQSSIFSETLRKGVYSRFIKHLVHELHCLWAYQQVLVTPTVLSVQTCNAVASALNHAVLRLACDWHA